MQQMTQKAQIQQKEAVPLASHGQHAVRRTARAQSELPPTMSNHVLLRQGACAIQTKLVVGAPNDQYEQEADRVADAVMRMPEPVVQRQSEEGVEEEEESDTVQMKPAAEPITPLVQRQSEEKMPGEEEEERPIQAKAVASEVRPITSRVSAQIASLRGSGEPLPGPLRAFFEPRFGHQLDQVRVHTDARASETAGSLKARAFTIGQDIVFGSGQYVPESKSGRELLAHELTHVVQQGRCGVQGNSDLLQKAELMPPLGDVFVRVGPYATLPRKDKEAILRWTQSHLAALKRTLKANKRRYPDGLEKDILWEKLVEAGRDELLVVYGMILSEEFKKQRRLERTHPYSQIGYFWKSGTRAASKVEVWYKGKLGCGAEVLRFSESYLGGAKLAYRRIVKVRAVPKQRKLAPSRIVYVDDLKDRVEEIKRSVKAGIAVRVPLVYHAFIMTKKGSIRPQHYVSIVGFRGNNFLYIDPYPGFSTTRYAGSDVDFMGYLEYDAVSNQLKGKSRPDFRIIAAP